MTTVRFSKSERANILLHYIKLMSDHRVAVERGDRAATRQLLSQSRVLIQRYWDGLPRIAMSCCPFDGQTLMRSFDPFGLDGPWWRQAVTRPNPPSCSHFCVLRGAVNFNRLPAQGGLFEAHTGPEVPYVIPRLLQLPQMVAVVAQVSMDQGYAVYLIAYFAKTRPPIEKLTADWPDNIFHYATASGEKLWRAANDSWDFDLQAWLKQGLLRWCPPGSDNRSLAEVDSKYTCPFLKLTGKREPIVIEGSRSWTESA